MVAEIINEKLKSVKFKGASWDVSFTPTSKYYKNETTECGTF